MALINCPKCSGTVSTKAPACPHCGGAPVDQRSEKERLYDLANELGSISAAIAANEELDRTARVKEKPLAPEDGAKGSTSTNTVPTYMMIILVAGTLLRLWHWYDKNQTRERMTQEHAERVEQISAALNDVERAAKEMPRAFGTRPEHYSLDQYMRVPESGTK